MLIGHFVSQGVSHKEVKKILGITQKRGTQIKRALNQGRTHGTRIIASLDTFLHLLLKECENTDSLKDFTIS